jgi:cobalt/nickel transport system ATP-binding protein
MGPALEVSNLRFSYPDGTSVLDGVDFSMSAGERVALLGPNGAGKTTFLLHLIGVLAGSGSVRVGGLELADDSLREIRRRVGFVFQDPDDQLFMPTVYEDVAFGPANFGVPDDEVAARVTAALDAVGMEGSERRAPHHLSGGERRRVAVATVLACRPELLVLDEPSSNLDPTGRRELADVLAGLDTGVLLVTHDLPYALQLCERAVVMNAGRIVADGKTAEILSDRQVMESNRLELPAGFDPGSFRT